MTPFYADEQVVLHAGDCLAVLPTLADRSVDAVITDPPYGLGFMGKEWDSGKAFVERRPQRSNTFDHVGGNHNPVDAADAARTRRVESQRFGAWCEGWVAECLRVLKPGGHLLAFGGTRTAHRLACAVEDAGFEVRDSIAWLYGSGFPKSLDVSKAIDRAAGAEREVTGSARGHVDTGGVHDDDNYVWRPVYERRDAPATDEARRWAGWGTALKPAHEPIIVARKPLDGTVAGNVQAHGTGALNIEGCRVPGVPPSVPQPQLGVKASGGVYGFGTGEGRNGEMSSAAGRWPTNVVLDEATAADLDRQTGTLVSGANPTRRGSDTARDTFGEFAGQAECVPARGADSGGASRFFPVFRYEAKADTAQRPRAGGVAHPTVKPLDLMRWLVRLVTPPGGLVLDPFAGSGTTAEACILEGFRCVTVEREPTYLPLIVARLTKPLQPALDMEVGA